MKYCENVHQTIKSEKVLSFSILRNKKMFQILPGWKMTKFFP